MSFPKLETLLTNIVEGKKDVCVENSFSTKMLCISQVIHYEISKTKN